MNLMDGSHVMLPMIKVKIFITMAKVAVNSFLDGKVTGRGCSKRNRICVDMNPSMMFPMCKQNMKYKI